MATSMVSKGNYAIGIVLRFQERMGLLMGNLVFLLVEMMSPILAQSNHSTTRLYLPPGPMGVRRLHVMQSMAQMAVCFHHL